MTKRRPRTTMARSPRSRRSTRRRKRRRRRPRRSRSRRSKRKNSTRPSPSGQGILKTSLPRSMLPSTSRCPTTGKTTLVSSTSLLRVSWSSALFSSFPSVHLSISLRPRGPRTTSSSTSAASSSPTMPLTSSPSGSASSRVLSTLRICLSTCLVRLSSRTRS